jgi:hypothetical protein
MSSSYDYSYINPSKCTINYCMGRRGFGKSNYIEYVANKLFQVGWTVLDIWASDNLENAFACINLNCKDNPDTSCNCRTAYPITLLAPDNITFDQNAVDRFNKQIYTQKEWYKKFPNKNFDLAYPPMKPVSDRPKELVKIVKLPRPTKSFGTAKNIEIADIFEQTVLNCRDERRYMIFNPKMFPSETDSFRTLEIIIRKMNDVAYKHFHKLSPQDVGKTTRSEMTNQEKCYDKMVVVCRELGEIAPSSKLKADASGESVKVKKALLSVVRKLRHHQISLLTDFQNYFDIESSIRSQLDLLTLVNTTKRLGGDELKWVFDTVEERHYAIKKKYGRKGKQIADKCQPLVNELKQGQAYIVYPNDHIRLWDIPMPPFHHKNPDEHWEVITGIKFGWTKDTIAVVSGNGATDEKLLFGLIYEKRKPSTGKPLKWVEVLDYLALEQTKGTVVWDKDFKEMKSGSLAKMFERWLARYEKS